MRTKTLKSTKLGTKRKNVPSDVSPSTSLPPLVEGELRCFLRVTVCRVLWTVPKPPLAPIVRLRWWGESSNGTHFRPRDGSRVEQRGVKTTARFAIRCGPKQFTSYLTDMGNLVLDVLTKPEHLPVGRVQVTGIARLSPSLPISGFFTVVSPTSDKLGELQVSLALEPLTETYDSSSSVPTTDMSVEAAHVPQLDSLSKAASCTANPLPGPPLSGPLSCSGGIESARSSSANTPRGKDHLYFQERGNPRHEATGPEGVLVNPWSPTGRTRSGKEGSSTVPNRTNGDMAQNQNSMDILSVLLDRGSKLRNAMVVSALKSTLDSELVLRDTHIPMSKDNAGTASRMPPVSSSGKLLDHLSSEPSLLDPRDPHEYPDQSWAADAENRAVQLLLGSINGSELLLWDGEGSPPGRSGSSSLCGDSQLSDPLHDQSLLETLFYGAPKPDCSPGGFSDREGGPSVKKSRGKEGAEQLRRSSASNGLDPEEVNPISDEVLALGVDRIAMLGQIRLAGVVVHTLKVPTESSSTTPHKLPNKGRPPRPLPTRKCSYFVEYLFPLASGRRDVGQVSTATELTRITSNKVAGGLVKFQQRFVFPVQFNGTTIEHWWKSNLDFKIYSRKSFQKKPVPLGVAVFPLRSLLLSECLHQSVALPVLGQGEDVGPLKVSLELATDDQGGGQGGKIRAITSPHRKATATQNRPATLPESPSFGPGGAPAGSKGGGCAREETSTFLDVLSIQEAGGQPCPSPSHATSHAPLLPSPRDRLGWRSDQEEDGLLLHSLLMVPEGKDFSCGPTRPLSVYLTCKLFGSDEATSSAVSWGHKHPTFNFVQVAPVALTSKQLERMRNNLMVIEVWQKGGGGSLEDRLLGLVKLPLHQFYMSFRDPKISRLLLQAQYPVVGVDSYVPVVDLLSGSSHGHLRVLLAMGLAQQIASLQRLREDDLGSVANPPRPFHSLDMGQHAEAKVEVRHEEAVREHVFEVRVERVKGLTPLQSTVWGEADCYVQYSFPAQEGTGDGPQDTGTVESGVSLRQFRTATTLCVPDPEFGHSETHVLLAPGGVPIQRLLLSCCSSQGVDTRGGIQFEVWCRYYYPNVREQLVARGLMPLSKLCAMVTMQKEEQTGTQVFSLPLVARTESPSARQPQPSGLLDVCVHYKHRPVRTAGLSGGAVAPRVVMLAAQVHRASGLQAAARALARRDGAFQYCAEVGVNAYVTMELSFFPEGERRCTRVVARSFCPEFEHHTEFPCSLVAQGGRGEVSSLAERLEGGALVFTVHHRETRRVTDSPVPRDSVLGTARVPLADLIHKRTGLSGWFAVSLLQDPPGSAHLGVVGGLEISIHFAHQSDRERVVHAALALGWDMGGEEKEEESEAWPGQARMVSVVGSVPRVWLPLHCLLLPGHRRLAASTLCYFRYKLYDQEAFCSRLRAPSLQAEDAEGEAVATVTFGGSPQGVALESTAPLHWYLQEERLEVQLWVSFGKRAGPRAGPRPHDTDRLVGSAYVDLSSLASRGQQKLTVTGVYPLFRRSAPNLAGAALRVHVAMTPTLGTLALAPAEDGWDECGSQGALSPGEEEEQSEEGHSVNSSLSGPSCPPSRRPTKSSVAVEMPVSPDAVVDTENTVAVSITVERAMHLSLRGSPMAESSGAMPRACVSYSTADAAGSVTTPVIPDTDCPIWDHQQQSRLSKQILLDPQQTLVFKVWHEGDVERVIGFASVDLSPLLSGFQSVCGWYNITDFSGQCQGQLKVSVSPLESVQGLRSQRKMANEDCTKDPAALFQDIPLYHTSATYNTFPAHITRYPEQRVNAWPDQLDALLSAGSREVDRREEHMANVRLFHQSLLEGDGHRCRTSVGDAQPSNSMLFSALRKNLSELDDIQRYFSGKLSTPTFPGPSDQGHRTRQEVHRDSEADTARLLLRSNHLVGEVNHLISGVFGGLPQGSNKLTVSDGVPAPAEEPSLPLHGTSEAWIPSPVPETPPALGNSQLNDQEKTRQLEDEGKVGNRFGEEEEEEYEETVIELRALNEVTSLTDRTSPWTSLLSEPDLSSLESLEGPEEVPAKDRSPEWPGLNQNSPPDVPKDLLSQVAQGWRAEDTAQSVSNIHPGQPPGTEETANRSPQDGGEESDEAPAWRVAELRPLGAWESGRSEAACSQAEDGELPDPVDHNPDLEDPDPVEIPNFFLPTHHLEASMRALRLAPVFPTALPPGSGETSVPRGIPFRRAPRLRHDVSSVKKEETRRIAKIFASHFSETK